MTQILRSPKVQRAMFAAIGIFLMVFGVGVLLQGSLHYRNWWGGLVFAPFVILIGAGLLLIVIFKWKSFSALAETRSRFRGWPK